MERADLEQWKAREVARLLALVETERRYYQEIIATLPVGLLVVASDLSIISANRAIRKIFGLRGGSVRGRLDALVPDSVLDQVRQVLDSGNPQLDLQVSTELNGGRRLRIGIQGIQNWDEGEQEALLTIEDVTDLQQTSNHQDATAVSPASAEVVENLQATVWAVSIPSMKAVFLSKHVNDLLGFEAAHWLENGVFWKERIHPDDRDWVLRKYNAALADPAEHNASVVCEYRAITAVGNAIWVRETARILSDPEGHPQYLMGITADVTQRRLLEEQLVQSNRVDAASKLAARLAHDLNNMLMILTGYGEELLSHFPDGNPMRADVQEILTATERVGGLTNQLLAFTRRPPVSPSAIDLSGTLKAIQPSLREALGAGIELELVAPPQPVAVKADLTLQQVIGAFVRRAREVMPNGGRLSIRVSAVTIAEDLRRPDALHPGNYAVLAFQDTGPRYDAEARAALFESFLPGKETGGESGALLARAYASVRQWGGDIAVSEAPGKGSIFEIFLPVVSEPVQTVAPAIEQPAATPPPSPPKAETILVVEDEGGIRSLVRKILRRQGYEVLEAVNGKQALEICGKHAAGIDLLVTDVMMPEMGGRELVDQLRRDGRHMKVLYVSGYTDDPAIYAADLTPGTAFLQKPFTLGSLLDKVKEVLAAKVAH